MNLVHTTKGLIARDRLIASLGAVGAAAALVSPYYLCGGFGSRPFFWG